MLFLFGGKYKDLARFILGIICIAAGLLISHGVLFVALGGVLAVWGASGTVSLLRGRGRGRPGQGGRA